MLSSTLLFIFSREIRCILQFNLKTSYVSFISCSPMTLRNKTVMAGITLDCISEHFFFLKIMLKGVFKARLL